VYRESSHGRNENGYGKKTVITDTGQIELEVPPDRQARFDPYHRTPAPLHAGCGRRPQPGDHRQNFCKHLPRHRDLGHLERHVAAVADDLRAHLDPYTPDDAPILTAPGRVFEFYRSSVP
jgi:hypothetical protein